MRKGEPIVVVKYVSKSYGKVEALKEVSLVVEQGEIFGLIGPDGAGKFIRLNHRKNIFGVNIRIYNAPRQTNTKSTTQKSHGFFIRQTVLICTNTKRNRYS